MIENFVPQPYPLECSADDGTTWLLVLGWSRDVEGILVPVISNGGPQVLSADTAATMDYRPINARPSRFPATTAMRTPRGPSTA